MKTIPDRRTLSTLLLGTIVVLTFFSFRAFPQNPSGPLSLREAVEEARKNNPVLAASQSRQRASEQYVKMAQSAYFPRADFEEVFTNSNDPVYVFGTLLRQGEFSARHFDPNFLNDPSARNNFNHRFSLQQLIYDGGRRERQKAMALSGKEMASQSVRLTEQQLLLQVIQNYYRVALADVMLATAQESLRNAEAGLKRVQDRFEVGMAVKSDVLRMEVQRADFSRQLLAAQNECRQARQSLERDLGREPEGLIQIRGRLKEDTRQVASVPDLIQEAGKLRPDLRQASMAVTMAADKIRSARGTYLPTLGAIASYDFHNGTREGWGNNYMVGVRMQFNLFDAGAKSAALQQAHEEKRAAEYDRIQAQRQSQLEISSAHDRKQVAWEQYRVAKQAAEMAEEAMRIMENRHAEGLTTTTDLLSMQTARHQARLAVSQALYQYVMESAALEMAAGQLSVQSPLIAE